MSSLSYIALLFLTVAFISACDTAETNGTNEATNLATLKIELGEKIFTDSNLSTPAGQSCESCHQARAAFTDPDVSNTRPVSQGADGVSFGNRNAPTAAYAAFIPVFQLNDDNEYVGGQFLDGRAATLAEQAKGPFLNPLEMANTDEAEVIGKILNSSYANQFKQVYGESSLNDVNRAYGLMADAIAAFESSDQFAPFSAKFDSVMAGTASFSAEEQRGFDLFKKTGKGKCGECHVLGGQGNMAATVFSNFKYFNIGVPVNPYNPDKTVDIGLAANDAVAESRKAMEKGKFRTPTLRNVELTAPYMHNGALQTLEQVVRFYSERDEKQCYSATSEPVLVLSEDNCWPEPEVRDNLDETFTGRLSLFPDEVSDLVAFLKTLTDGYQP